MRVPLQIDWLSDQNRVQNHTCSVFVVRHDNKLTDRQCSMSLALSPQSTQRTLIFVRRSSLANSYIMIIGWKTIICWLLVKTEKKTVRIGWWHVTRAGGTVKHTLRNQTYVTLLRLLLLLLLLGMAKKNPLGIIYVTTKAFSWHTPHTHSECYVVRMLIIYWMTITINTWVCYCCRHIE